MSRNMVEASQEYERSGRNGCKLVASRLSQNCSAIALMVVVMESVHRVANMSVFNAVDRIVVPSLLDKMELTEDDICHLESIHKWCYRHQTKWTVTEYTKAAAEYAEACDNFKVNPISLELQFEEVVPPGLC